jgi:endoglucanase
MSAGQSNYLNVDYVELTPTGCGTPTTTTTTPSTTPSTTTTSTTTPTTATTTTTVPSSTTTTLPPGTPTPIGPQCAATRIEAESGLLTGVLVDTNWQPWTGTGVVGFFDQVGDRIVWPLQVATAGSYDVRFRYAKGTSGSATRRLERNTTTLTNLTFAGTGAWSSYQTLTTRISLPAGRSDLGLAFRSGQTGLLNVDHVDVAPAGCLPAPT